MDAKKAILTTFYQSTAAEYLLVGMLGGVIYFTLEVVWRGWSHISMAACGALCFVFFYHIESKIRFRRLPLIFKAVVGGMTISTLELAAGLFLNKLFGLGVWDYSSFAHNFLGQVCLQMSILWILLSFFAFLLCDVIRRNVFLRP